MIIRMRIWKSNSRNNILVLQRYKGIIILLFFLAMLLIGHGVTNSLADGNTHIQLEESVTPTRSSSKPTRTPRPTITPPAIPPPQDVSQTNLMIVFVILAVVIVVVGIWINRERKE